MKIITLTLNPAFDSHCSADSLRLGCENFARIESCEAGGKGINISRALSSYGIESRAVLLLGKENGEQFKRALLDDRMSCSFFETEGRIRENITIHSKNTSETRISFDGFEAGEDDMARIEDHIADKIDNETILTFTGSLPVGISSEASVGFLKRMKERGARIVIDSRSLSLDDILAVKPWLIKPNEEEIVNYSSLTVCDLEGAARAASELFRRGYAENVMISLGAKGAVLACRDGVFAVPAPHIDVRSTIGAGDSSIAGFIAAHIEGKGALRCLKLAVAFGSAACLSSGTKPPQKKDIKKLAKIIKKTV